MTYKSVIAFDLETVPDLEAAGRMLGMAKSAPKKIRAALPHDKEGELKFPKHPLHKIACIGTLAALWERNDWRVQSISAPHIGEHSEAELIKGFVDQVRELRPQLVTFNGNGFDLPVLRYRAMLNRVAAPGF